MIMAILLVSFCYYFKTWIGLVFKDNTTHPTRHAISGGHFPQGVKYRLIQAHWHWGVNNSVGSEHVVDGARYPLEVHMVHYNEKYQDKDEAFQHPDGVTVNTFLYTVMKNLFVKTSILFV